ncbi:MAG: hypothetical protein R6V57_14660 [Vicinamibacterales bacterium]
MFAAKRHLDDDVLIRRYLADRGLAALEAGDDSPLRHLAHCPACEARYEALRAGFDESREAAIADAEAACTPDRMERQRDRILRRIDALQTGPRVLAFPAAAQNGQAAPQTRVFRRWVAAAAAASFLVGLGAGRLVFNEPSGTTTADARQQTAPASARQAPTMRALHVEPAVNDEEFLSEIELATAAPRTRELRAIYAFTLGESRDVPRAVGKD